MFKAIVGLALLPAALRTLAPLLAIGIVLLAVLAQAINWYVILVLALLAWPASLAWDAARRPRPPAPTPTTRLWDAQMRRIAPYVEVPPTAYDLLDRPVDWETVGRPSKWDTLRPRED